MTFYWQHARDSLLTDTAIRIFQIACVHGGEDFNTAKTAIDDEYERIIGRTVQRHGGLFQTYIQAFQEAGWLVIEDGRIRITPAGDQARDLLGKVPDFMKAVPTFVVELLARYQLNNPAKPPARNTAVAEEIKTTDVFPYWTIWKIMRECDKRLTTEELRRFVLQLHDSDKIDETIQAIKAFRRDKASGMSEDQLNERYPAPLLGAVGESKYIMGRAGVQIGSYPPLITKPSPDAYELNDDYLRLIDSVLAHEPVYKEHLTAESWLADYGKPVPIAEELVFTILDQPETIPAQIPGDDPVLTQVLALLDEGHKNFMLSGPPGTSKTWYARQLAQSLVAGDPTRMRFIQFHPSFAYEDFIEGFVPVSGSAGVPVFRLSPKIFVESATAARHSESVVLVIDEFSRGDAGRIFGEVLTYLEPGYREVPFTLASGSTFAVPENLFVIGTMNPFDRSVTDIDAAMLRRFAVMDMKPSEILLRALLLKNGLEAEMLENVVTFFRECQAKMPLGGLGHTYFIRAKDLASLRRLWSYELLPLFQREFVYEPDTLDSLRAAFTQLFGADE